MPITAAQILRLAPTARADLVAAIVDHWSEAEAAGLTTPRRIRHFFARVVVETGGLTAIEENLNYSVEGLLTIFSRTRISEAQARALGRTASQPADQQAIANLVYGGAWGLRNLGNTEPGDGWRYRGGGMLQTTGRANYRKLGLEVNPEALRQPVSAFLSAIAEWQRRGCNTLADAEDVAGVCKAINGGTNGLAEQRAALAKAASIWPDAPAPAPAAPVLRFRDSGPEVRDLQEQLTRAGYYKGAIAGSFGPRTEAAVIDAQRKLGLKVDGIAGPATRAALTKLL